MTYPNRNVLWASVLIDELVEAGVEAVCVAPGSRSTPLTVACYEHEDLRVFSHLDERSAAYFALGRALETGRPTPLICTSGTAAANFHPAVLEADRSRVPMLLLTADRPPELRDSGANQTVDQVDLYGDAVRWFRDLPEPEPADRKLRRLRVDAARAVATATGTPAGPVHLNVPFRKPLEPVTVDDGVEAAGLGGRGREGAFVEADTGTLTPSDGVVGSIADDVAAADRTLLVAGAATPTVRTCTPSGSGGDDTADESEASLTSTLPAALASLARTSGAPLLVDPLSGARFGEHVADCPLVCGGYDAYLGTGAVDAWPDPEVVVRVGASPTSKPLRKYLAGTDARQVLVDPAGEWREAEFGVTDLLTADPGATADAVADAVRARGVDPDADGRRRFRERFATAETEHWSIVDERLDAIDRHDSEPDGDVTDDHVPNDDRAPTDDHTPADDHVPNVDHTPTDGRASNVDHVPFEGAVVPAVLEAIPDRATVFASNSMPVRDLDRFAPPTERSIDARANRGASGIDGIASSALGVASAADGPLVAIVGDLAYYHDLTGLLAAQRCDVDATIVLVNNDGGGIFHALPIEQFEPPFTEGFRTPHGLDFEPTGSLFDLEFRRVDLADLSEACGDAVGSSSLDVLEVQFDAESSHRTRESLVEELDERLRTTQD